MNLNKFYEVSERIKNNGEWTMRSPNGLVRLLYSLVIAFQPNVCLDIGAFVGFSALWIARGLEENDKGKVHTIEVEKKWLDIAKQNIQEAGLENRVDFIQGDSQIILTTYDFGEQIDLLFLDNGNKPLYKIDFEAVESRLSNNAIIIAHDTGYGNSFESATSFREFVEMLSDYDTFQIDAEYGITLIKKKGGKNV